MGAPPGILAAASPVPAKVGSVRTHLRRRSPRGHPSRAGWRRSARPGTKSAAREVWFGSGIRAEPYPPIPPSCASPPGRGHGPGLPHPSGFADRRLPHPLGPRGREDKGACLSARRSHRRRAHREGHRERRALVALEAEGGVELLRQALHELEAEAAAVDLLVEAEAVVVDAQPRRALGLKERDLD